MDTTSNLAKEFCPRQVWNLTSADYISCMSLMLNTFYLHMKRIFIFLCSGSIFLSQGKCVLVKYELSLTEIHIMYILFKIIMIFIAKTKRKKIVTTDD